MNKIQELEILAARIRKTILAEMAGTGAGHVGGSMSIADVLAVLYGEVMQIDPANPRWEKRDRMVVSKGHCGPALYAALAERGYFPRAWIPTVNQPGTHLPSHCDKNRVPGVDMTTGSLGQGMSTALGLAWGLRYQNNSATVYLILGDGECDEGQVWEGALFASTQKLGNVIAFIDRNEKQLDGYTKDICDVGDLRTKFEDFGWYSQEVDGHDITAMLKAIENAKAREGQPSMIVLHTIKGKDCPFAEGVFYNHHMTMSPDQIEQAQQFLDQKIARLQEEI
ncbi:transketolase [Holdemania massiliensis]|uniref:transketolase n=1 Tax=Holdemania massiliensis TaxID=1468449 RepID=UPI001F059C41|nr:transketolase [Holdemania massiliensis]MCH1942032.1 transketolase [Holdemania massiliensis]